MEATTKTGITIQDMIDGLNAGRSCWIATHEAHHFISYINEFEPSLKVDAQINYEPGKTKLSKR